MNEIPIAAFQEAILATHEAAARLERRERVVERFQCETVWEGEVLIFELLDHPTAHRCYAWEVDGEVAAVLREGPVKSVREAVRAAIIASGGENGEA